MDVSLRCVRVCLCFTSSVKEKRQHSAVEMPMNLPEQDHEMHVWCSGEKKIKEQPKNVWRPFGLS